MNKDRANRNSRQLQAFAEEVALRDGSIAAVRLSTRDDIPALRRFFHDLSGESRYRRFFAAGDPPERVIDRLSDSTNASSHVTLIAEGSIGGSTRIIAAASYATVATGAAEVAFAVADESQGKGLGTALLERLAVLASQAGIHRFHATTLADNAPMLEVLRDSGFEIRSKSMGGGELDIQISLASRLFSLPRD